MSGFGVNFFFLDKVKLHYEAQTGEAMLPMSDWSEDVRNKFMTFMQTNDPKGFVEYVLNGDHHE